MYFAEMLPTFTEVKDTAQAILEMNQANMVSADTSARQLAEKDGLHGVHSALRALIDKVDGVSGGEPMELSAESAEPTTLEAAESDVAAEAVGEEDEDE